MSIFSVQPPFFSNKSYKLQLFYLLFLIVCGFTICSTLALFIKPCFEPDINFRWYLYIVQIVTAFGTFFLPALVFSYCASKSWLSYNVADTVAPPKLVGYVLVLSLFILPIVVCLGYINEQISFPDSMQKMEVWLREMEEKSKIALQLLTANSNVTVLFLNIVVLALFPAVFEEFLFRGTIQPLFTKWFANKHVAIIVTAFIFSVIHFQFYGFIPRLLLGIYLGYLFIWGRSLWLPIIAHFMHNAVSLIFDYGAQRRGVDLETIDRNQIPEFYPTVLLCTFCVAAGSYLLWKNAKKI